MQSALAEKRTMLNLPRTTDLGDNSIDPDATKMKALSKELVTIQFKPRVAEFN